MIVQHWHLKMVDTQAKTSGRQYAFSGDPLRRFSVDIAVSNSGKPGKKKKKKKLYYYSLVTVVEMVKHGHSGAVVSDGRHQRLTDVVT